MEKMCPLTKDECRYFGCGEMVCAWWNDVANQCQMNLALEAIIKTHLDIRVVVAEMVSQGRLVF